MHTVTSINSATNQAIQVIAADGSIRTLSAGDTLAQGDRVSVGPDAQLALTSAQGEQMIIDFSSVFYVQASSLDFTQVNDSVLENAQRIAFNAPNFAALQAAGVVPTVLAGQQAQPTPPTGAPESAIGNTGHDDHDLDQTIPVNGFDTEGGLGAFEHQTETTNLSGAHNLDATIPGNGIGLDGFDTQIFLNDDLVSLDNFGAQALDSTPQLVNDTATVVEDSGIAATGNVTDNDSANDGGIFFGRWVQETAQFGTFVANDDGSFSYIIDESNPLVDALNIGDTLTETFTYEVADADGDIAQETLTITIQGSNDAPVAQADSVVVEENTASTLSVIAATDVDGTITGYQLADDVAQGSLTFNADGTYSFDPNGEFESLGAGETQEVTFTYQAIDDNGEPSAPATITITVTGENDDAISVAVQNDLVETDAVLAVSGDLDHTDVDANNADDVWQVATIVGTYGTLEIDATGAYTFTANSAFDELDAGDVISEEFNPLTEDGTAGSLTITITGTDDASIISGDFAGAVEEDVTLQATGSIAISDVDGDDSPSFADVATTRGDNDFGDFTLVNGDWTYDLDNASAQVQALALGETVTDTITYTATDGSTQQIEVTITGTNDAPTVVDGTFGTDEDNAANGNVPAGADIDGTVDSYVLEDDVVKGDLTFNADGTYSFDPNGEFESLGAGQSEEITFTYRAVDNNGAQSEPATITITVSGVNDAAISGAVQNDLVETDAVLAVSGDLDHTDVDANNADDVWQVATIVGTYGTLEIDATGAYTFTANSAFDELDAGDVISEEFNPLTEDGTAGSLTITITGTDDASIISGDFAGAVEEDVTLQATGSIAISDVDGDDSPSFADVATTRGDNDFGDFTLVNGDWTYDLDNASAQVQALALGETVTDTITYTATDGSTQQIEVTITGTNDAPTQIATRRLTTTESTVLDNENHRGKADDVDNGASVTYVLEHTTNKGVLDFDTTDASFSFDPNGDFEHLNVGDQERVTFRYHAVDEHGAISNTTLIRIIVRGENDAAITTGEVVNLDETNAVLIATGDIDHTDVDNTDDVWQADTFVGTHGTLVLQTDGSYTYTANSAFDELDAGDVITDVFTPLTEDGTAGSITINITGTDDASVITGDFAGSVEEDVTLQTTGSIAINDPDAGQTPSFDDVATTRGDNDFGDFTLVDGDWTYDLDNTKAEIQALALGETVTDTITYTATDGSTQQIEVTITGSNDAPTLPSILRLNTLESDVLVDANTAGQADDVDNGATLTYVLEQDTAKGVLDFNTTDASFTFDTNGEFEHLNVGDIERVTFYYHAVDEHGAISNSTRARITIRGQNDEAITTAEIVNLNETNAVLVANGNIDHTDVDNTDDVWQADTFVGIHGTLVLQTDGSYTYTANSAFDELDAGDVITDVFTPLTEDGTAGSITINITGTDDAPVITGDFTGAVREEFVLQATGSLAISDVDEDANPAFVDEVAAGDNGYGTFTLVNGDWTYDLNNSHADVQALNDDEFLTDSYTFEADDGSTQTVTITIEGTNDKQGVVTEDFEVSGGWLRDTGRLNVAGETPLVFDTGSLTSDPANIGQLIINSAGNWTYRVRNNNVQFLDDAEQKTETFTIEDDNGTVHTITVVINGAEDVHSFSGTQVTVQEDRRLTRSGTVRHNDVDDADQPAVFTAFTDVVGNAGYGTFTLAADGSWSYQLDNSLDEINEMTTGDQLTDSIEITVTNGNGEVLTTTLTATINGFNDAPVGQNDAYNATESTGVSGQVTGTDVDGTVDGFILSRDVNRGDLTFDDVTGQFTFNPSGDFEELRDGQTTNVTFRYRPVDNEGKQGAERTITITVTGENDNASISGDNVGSVQEDTDVVSGRLEVTGSLTVTDPDNNESVFNRTVDAHVDNIGLGTLTIGNNGNWRFRVNNNNTQYLDEGESVTERYTVTSIDGTASEEISITIIGTADGLVLGGANTGWVQENGRQTRSGTLSARDADASDNPVTWQIPADDSSDEGYGTFTFDAATGRWEYTLDNDHPDVQALGQYDTGNLAQTSLTDTKTFTAINADGETETRTVTITIRGRNDAAQVSNETVEITETNSVIGTSGDLNHTDIDLDNDDDVWVAAVYTGNYGTLEVFADGTYNYETFADDTVDFVSNNRTVRDDFRPETEDGTSPRLRITIRGTDDAPVITGDITGSVTEDNILQATGTVLISDVDDQDDPQFIDIASTLGDNGYGTFTVVNGNWIYDLNNSHADVQALDALDTPLTDTITVSANDGSTVQITVNINGVNEGVNVAPVAYDGTASTDEDTASNDNVPAGFDSDGSVTSYVLEDDVVKGDLTFNADGTYSFDPNGEFESLGAGQSEDVTFTYRSIDDDGALSSPATITITVNGANDPAITGAVTEDLSETNAVLAVSGDLDHADTDANNNDDVWQAATIVGTHGTLVIDAAGAYTYTANSTHDDLDDGDVITDVFNPLTEDGTAGSLTITITGTNDIPVVTGSTTDQQVLVTEAINYTLPADLFGDVDESAVLTLSATLTNGDPLPNWLTFDAGLGLLTGNTDTAQTIDVRVTATDQLGASTSVDFAIDVDPASTSADMVTLNEDTSSTIDVFANDTIPASATLTSVTQGANGTVTFSADGNVTYTPNADYSGTDSFTYTVTIGGSTLTETVDVSVLPVADSVSVVSLQSSVGEPFDLPADFGELSKLDNDLYDVVPNGTNDTATKMDILDADTGEVLLSLSAEGSAADGAILDFSNGQGVGIVSPGQKGQAANSIDTGEQLLINLPGVVGALDLIFKNANGNMATITYFHTDGTSKTVTGAVLATTDSLASYTAVSPDNKPFTAIELSMASDGDGSAQFWGIDVPDPRPGVPIAYPASFSFDQADAVDGSQSFTVTISGLPVGASLTTVDDGSANPLTLIDNGDGTYTVADNDALDLNGGIFSSNDLIILTDTALAADFDLRVEVSITDSALTTDIDGDTIYDIADGDVITTSESISILGGSGSYDALDLSTQLVGTDSADTINGEAGNDYIDGQNGNDILIGGIGDDILIGGDGDDIFAWLAGETGSDTVKDFANGQNQIEIGDLLIGYDELLDDASDFITVTFDGDDTIISIDADGADVNGAGFIESQEIIIEGVDLTDNNTKTTDEIIGDGVITTDGI